MFGGKRCVPAARTGAVGAFCNADQQCAPLPSCAAKCAQLKKDQPDHPDAKICADRCDAASKAEAEGQ